MRVVICLKTRTFAVSQTTLFAARFWRRCCDLLENSYFCSIANNCLCVHFLTNSVVICLKTRTFAVSQTTCRLCCLLITMLWFAWKLVLLQYRKQLQFDYGEPKNCCDLLENSYFCSIANNKLVVWRLSKRLWFAWKLVLLQYRKQLGTAAIYHFRSCDLLENSYFCSIANNVLIGKRLWVLLWFAWKLVLLQYRKQRKRVLIVTPSSCDLLENSYFCSIANNIWRSSTKRKCVVICLKTRTFAVSQTTPRRNLELRNVLWFAWKLVLLQYRKQR